jgi:hypothetical protein
MSEDIRCASCSDLFMRTRLQGDRMNRNEAIANSIAKRIMANKRKRWAGLHQAALKEITMATPTTSNSLNTTAAHEASLKNNGIGSPADGRRLNGSGTQGTDINSGIAASQNSEVRPVEVKQSGHNVLEGSNAGDHRTAQAAPAVLPDNPAPREPRGQSRVMSSKLSDGDKPKSFLGASEASHT